MLAQVKLAALIVGLTLLSGCADSQGFIHAAHIWANRKVVWLEVGKSALGFSSGIIFYWIALKYLKEAQIAAPEIQTLIWFGVTIVGVAIASGKFAQWRGAEQLIATGVLLGIGWLITRTGG